MKVENGTFECIAGTVILVLCNTLCFAIALEVAAFHLFSPFVVINVEHLLGPICHHLFERSFDFHGEQFPVCARCTGLYVGWVVGTLFNFLTKPFDLNTVQRQRLMFSVTVWLLANICALLEKFGIMATSNLVRFFLGLPLGIVPGFWLSNIGRGLLAVSQSCQHNTIPACGQPEA